jgi:hypothetical protein
MFKRFAIGLLLTLAIPLLSYAQYGKISGKITDRETQEALVGASVLLEGTTIGASSDVNGDYVILNVPAGTYTIKATYVGYNPLTITEVSVVTGLTRDLPIQLQSAAVQAPTVEIVAQRPLIEKTATNAIRIVGSDDIQALPVRGVQAYFTLQPGVELQNGEVFMRGSRPDEVGYQIEGVSTTNIFGTGSSYQNVNYSGNYITTIPEALQEVSVQAGGYSAEFGGANSGIVQQTFKTGGSKWNFTAQGETDNFGNYPGKKFADTYSYGYSDYVVALGGPVLSDHVKLFLAGENNYQADNYAGGPLFWTGADFGYLHDTGANGGHKGDSALVQWDNGNLPKGMNNRYTLNGTLLLDYKPLQIRLAGAFTSTAQSNNSSIFDIFDLAETGLFQSNNLLLNGKISYFLSANTFFEVNINYLDYRDMTTDPNYGGDVLEYGDSLNAAAHGWTYASLISGPVAYDFDGFPFARAGSNLSGFGKTHNNYLGGSVDLTSQIGNHEIKIGGSYQYWTARAYAGVGAGTFGLLETNPDSARVASSLANLLRANAINNYGYDEFGNEYNGSGPDAPKHPDFAAGYIEDRIEFSDLVINAGLRFDNIFMDGWDFPNLLNPGFDTHAFSVYPYSSTDSLGYTTSKTFAYLEPRLGLSFPVTDRTVFHMEYGKFVQAPQLSQVLIGPALASQIFQANYYFLGVGDAYNIAPVRTTQYEVGLSQQFTDFMAFDATGFYKGVEGQLTDVRIITSTGAAARPYDMLTNGDFETVMGLEFSLRVRRIERLEAEVNYTLQDARGTNSFANGAQALENVAGIPITMVTPLDYDEANRGSIMLDYRFGKNDGGAILQQLGLNLLFTFNSGHPYTLATGGAAQTAAWQGAILTNQDGRSRLPVVPVNSLTTPWVYELDARIDKNFDLPGGMGLDIYIYAQNLLNTQNVINVYYRTGNAYSDGYLTSPSLSSTVVASEGPMYVPLYNVVNLQDEENQREGNGFDNFGMPRQVRVGARLEF